MKNILVMNKDQQDIFEFRQSIIDNADKLIQHGNKFKKTQQSGQLSLFGTTDIEITRFDLIKRELTDAELLKLADDETKAIGLPLTYDVFNEFFMIEKTLCNSTAEEVFFSTDKNREDIFLAKVQSIESRNSKSGNKYCKVFLIRNNIEIKTYLFGDDFAKQLPNIKTGSIHIVKTIRNGDMLSIKKIQTCDSIDASKYIKQVIVDISDCNLSSITSVRNHLYLVEKESSGMIVRYRNKGTLYDLKIDCKLSNEDCIKLIDYGCKIFIEKLP